MPTLVGNPLANRDQQIADLAYRFWQEEGHPQDRAEAHWLRAAELVDSETRKKPGPKIGAAARGRKKSS